MVYTLETFFVDDTIVDYRYLPCSQLVAVRGTGS